MDDGKTGYDPSPVNPLPPIVLVLFLAIFGIEAMLAAGEAGIVGGPAAVGWRLAVIRDYGFSPQVFDWMRETGPIVARFRGRSVAPVRLRRQTLTPRPP